MHGYQRKRVGYDTRSYRDRFHTSQRWQRIRNTILKREPYCRLTGEPASCVDHIDGNVDNNAYDNLQPLTHKVHSWKTSQFDVQESSIKLRKVCYAKRNVYLGIHTPDIKSFHFCFEYQYNLWSFTKLIYDSVDQITYGYRREQYIENDILLLPEPVHDIYLKHKLTGGKLQVALIEAANQLNVDVDYVIRHAVMLDRLTSRLAKGDL